MTAAVFAADLHVGNHGKFGGPTEVGINRRCAHTLRALQGAVDVANSKRAPLIIAGDLFDSTRPTPQMIAEVQSCLDEVQDGVYVIVGNHDQQSPAEGDHAMAPLWQVAEVVDAPVSETFLGNHPLDLVMIPYQPGPAHEWIRGAVESVTSPKKELDNHGHPIPRLLAIHLGVYDATWRPFWSKDSHDCVSAEQLHEIMDAFSIDVCFAGNWHTRRTWKEPRIVQVGSLCPTGWNDKGLRGHGVSVWQDGAITHHEVAGPRFVTLPAPQHPDFSSKVEELRKVDELFSIYVRGVADSPDEVLETKEYIESLGDWAGVVVEPDTTIAKAEAKTASIAARSADSLEEALAVYVQAMPLAEEIDRGTVLEKSKHYLAQAE